MKFNVLDNLKYPISDLRNLMILGVIVLMANAYYIFQPLLSSSDVLLGLKIFGFIVNFLVIGYQFKIIKSSLNGFDKLPNFNDLINTFFNGIKLSIIGIIYFMPVIVITVIFLAYSSPSILESIFLNYSYSNGGIILNLISSIGIWAYFLILIVLPIIWTAIVSMAKSEGEMKAALSINSIRDIIASKGLISFLSWYIIVLFSIVILSFSVGILILAAFSSLSPIIGNVFLYLLFGPYLITYLGRSIGMFFKN